MAEESNVPKEISPNIRQSKSKVVSGTQLVRASLTFDAIERKQRLLQERQERLRKRAELLKQSLHNVKLQREKIRRDRINAQRLSIRAANQRRALYLKGVKEKARTGIERRLLCGFSTDSPQNNATIPQKQLLDSEYHACDNFPSWPLQDSITEVIQFLEIYPHSRTFNKALKSAEPSLKCIFKFVGIPNSYFKPLMYSFYLVNNCHSCLKNGTVHPGFNCNVPNKVTQFIGNVLFVMLYKESLVFAQTLKYWITSGKLSQPPEIEPFKKSLHSLLKRYFLVFSAFKLTHFNNLVFTLKNALNINNLQRQVLNEGFLEIQHRRFEAELSLLTKYKKVEQDSILTAFLKKVNSRCSILMAVTPPLYLLLVLKRTYLRYQGNEFWWPDYKCFPKHIWRKFWFLKTLESSQRRVPCDMKSGRRLHNTNLLDIDEIFSKCNHPKLTSKYDLLIGMSDKDSHKELLKISRRLYEDTVLWCAETNMDSGFQPPVEDSITSMFKKISSMLVNDGQLSELASNITSLKDNIELVFDTASMKGKAENASDISSLKGNTGLSHTLAEKILMFEQLLVNRICRLSTPLTPTLYLKFENSFVLFTSPNFVAAKFHFYTNSPTIIFPKLYLNLRKWKECPSAVNVEATIDACYHIPVFTHLPKAGARMFYREYFAHALVHGQDHDEVNSIVLDFLDELRDEMLRYTRFCAFMQLKEAYSKEFGYVFDVETAKSEFNDKIISNNLLGKNFHSDQVAPFYLYYRNNAHTIEKILHIHFERMLRDTGNHISSFRYCENEIEKLLKRSIAIIDHIYNVYNPVLNWVYKDLGME